MKKIIDIIFSLILLFFLFIPSILIMILIKVDSRGPIIHWSKRVGQKNKIFKMPKFRTMNIITPQIDTNSLKNPDYYITRIGKYLRRYSLDEIPQLYSIIIGDMSLVGPRPALYNQNNLIELRAKHNVHLLLPGITGYAQVNGRDNINIDDKVLLDIFYKKNFSIALDFKILIQTIVKVFHQENVSH
jgi:O-antigen biosynthesis protein WbqP